MLVFLSVEEPINRPMKRSHPWMNERSKQPIMEKNNAEGTPRFVTASAKCATVLAEERTKHVQKVKHKMAALPKASKQWWKINRELLRHRCTLSSIPTLREDGRWIKDAKEKADAFARNFKSKAHLPEELVDTPFWGCATDASMPFFSFRSRNIKRLFQKLDECKATGGDMISANILKRLCDGLAVPFTIVVRRLFYEGCWPTMWKYHLICPIFKRGPAFTPGNYRGVHLTTILSKVAEKIVGAHLVLFLQKKTFGKNQWAFSPGLSFKNLMTMLMMSFILAVCTNQKTCAFLSDSSGAFDRVSKEILLSKLQGFGVGKISLRFLDSYLAPCVANKIAQEKKKISEVLIMNNTV